MTKYMNATVYMKRGMNDLILFFSSNDLGLNSSTATPFVITFISFFESIFSAKSLKLLLLAITEEAFLQILFTKGVINLYIIPKRSL